LAAYSLGTGQHYSADASLLLHRHLCIGPEARAEHADPHGDGDVYVYDASISHTYPRATGAHEDAAANADAMVSTDAYADARGHVYSYAKRDADRDVNAFRYADDDAYSHAVADPNAVCHEDDHADCDSDQPTNGHADQSSY